jgi:hypothetical protein
MPALIILRINSFLISVGKISGSLCNPSLGPTSSIEIEFTINVSSKALAIF